MDTAARVVTLPALLLPLVPALLVIVILSKLPEPVRMRVSAVSAAGFTGLYLNGGFGAWELVYMAVASVPAYYAQRSYSAAGVAWLMHAGWDLLHHFYGNTLWHWDPMSSLGCAIMDPLVALWFFAGAPSVLGRSTRAQNPADAPRHSPALVQRIPD
jgi:hypothetical protein